MGFVCERSSSTVEAQSGRRGTPPPSDLQTQPCFKISKDKTCLPRGCPQRMLWAARFLFLF
jgi:hypothetical protein